MTRSLLKTFLCLLMLPLGYDSFSQLTDTSFVSLASANAVKKYRTFIQGQSGLYSGSEYRLPRLTNEDHPFYMEHDWFEGSVQYNGETYDDTHLMYDLTTDNIIIEHFYNGQSIVLVRAKVEGFTMRNDRFIHLNGAALLPGLPGAGFYRVLHDGESRLLAKYVKQPDEKIENNKVEVYFPQRTRYYLLKDDTYHKVSSRGDLLKVFHDRKQDVRHYISDHKLKFSKDNPAAFAAVASYYDSLNPEKK